MPHDINAYAKAINSARSVIGESEIGEIKIADFIFFRWFWFTISIVYTLLALSFRATRPLTLPNMTLALKMAGHGNLMLGVIIIGAVAGVFIALSERFPKYFCDHFRRKAQIIWLYQEAEKTETALREQITAQYHETGVYPEDLAVISKNLTKAMREMATYLETANKGERL